MSEVYGIYYKKYRYGFRIGTYSGFVRGFCAAPIAPYLVAESQLALATFDRLRRTRTIMYDAIQLGLKHPRVLVHCQRIQAAHAHIQLTNDHFLYVASNLVIDPIRVLRMYSQKSLTKSERYVFLQFWKQFCEAIGLEEVPETLGQWIMLRNSYERKYEAYNTDQRTLLQTCFGEVLKVSLPRYLRQAFYFALPWLVPERMRRGFDLPMHRRGLFYLRVLKWAP